MKNYLYSLLLVSVASALIGILSPDGEKGGIGKHIRLLSSLILICVLIVPLKTGISYLISLSQGDLSLPGMEDEPSTDYRDQMQNHLDAASKEYFCQGLTQTLERECSISPGEVRCIVKWENDTPVLITVVLSGKAIWKDPQIIEDFVTDLLNCPCQTAIE